ncbi:unnamed protein product, partial [Mesorhabditis spiculigera]
MLLQLVLLFGLLTAAESLDCFSCGVFLTAPSQECRGSPLNVTCHPDNLGCVKITAPNTDGTFYVEKRCAEKEDDLDGGCSKITIRGLIGEHCFTAYAM